MILETQETSTFTSCQIVNFSRISSGTQTSIFIFSSFDTISIGIQAFIIFQTSLNFFVITQSVREITFPFSIITPDSFFPDFT
jgi:hypothetical protein